jgi:hypothetical protein
MVRISKLDWEEWAPAALYPGKEPWYTLRGADE